MSADLWPNFYIVGAPKAGTSSLHAYLQAVPGIFMSKIKEPNYFSRIVVPDDHPLRPIRDREKYLQLFAGVTNELVIGEASPTYLADPEAPRLIREVAPDCRILISLRDPVERAFSHYLMMRNNGKTNDSFLNEIRRGLELQSQLGVGLLRPEVGLYHRQVKRYQETFNAAQIKVILFEEFMSNSKGTLEQILGFLGIRHDLSGIRRAGLSGVRRSPRFHYPLHLWQPFDRTYNRGVGACTNAEMGAGQTSRAEGNQARDGPRGARSAY